MLSAGAIFEAWIDEPWTVDGAAVRVSLVCFGAERLSPSLKSHPVVAIHADLTAETTNLAKARPQPENLGVSFMSDTKGGAFDIEGKIARSWLIELLNPNGRPNSEC